ncbi:hypothetical protein Glove_64g97 [Diversispora epigaea]|uniref:Serine-threonine/tyrosine-protein kinase catalytic domain-containing protein n=1 Tax=Diversispora epigaea TaxID=1348612 RepID=A0A397JB59_9GLOM|nr:hypothetical protein Glove_64g97 [Diversispora epigaea]
MSANKCPECRQECTTWCKPLEMTKWINAQLNANNYYDVLEWILYDRFKDVKQTGGLMDILKWDIENLQLKRWGEEEVALKMFDNFVNFNDALNEMAIHLKSYTGSNDVTSIAFYGITQDPEKHSYMIVLEYASDGNLREYLKNNFNNINWLQKLYNLWDLSYRLSKLIGANPNNPEKYNMFGVLPYIAPEVLTMKICNGLLPKIPFHTPKLITRTIMRCWDARSTLNYSKLPKPKNEENFERDLEELTRSDLCPSNSDQFI